MRKQLFFCKDGPCAERRSLELARRTSDLLQEVSAGELAEVHEHSCFGLCDDGPHVIVYPDRAWYVGVEEEELPAVVEHAVGAGERLTHLETADPEALAFILDVLDSEGFDGAGPAPRAPVERPTIPTNAFAPGARALLVDDAPEPYFVWVERSMDPAALINAVQLSGLRGRGGAGFPVGRKLAFARESHGSPRYVVVNGAEDEPGSGKDQFLLTNMPDVVIEGAMLAAYAVGAAHIVFYLAEDFPESVQRVEEALRRADHVGLRRVSAPEHFEGGGLTASVVLSPPTYVAGEDTAALELIEGRQALPREKPPYPTSAGLLGKPTLVSNVETLAALARIAWRGPDWYRSMGTEESPGTMLFTLGEELAQPGIYELELGTPLRDLVERHGGGLRSGEDIRFVLPGGPSSGFLSAGELDVPLSYEALRAAGSALGCGVVRVYGSGDCVVEALERILDFFARECCGQCPPCRMETGVLLRLVGQVKAGGSPELLARMTDALDYGEKKGGLCSFITMPGLPVRSALQLFPEDFEHHLRTGTCAMRPE